MRARFFAGSGMLLMALAVMLGAFGAHALRASLNVQQLQTWQTATEYQVYHALALLALGIWMESKSPSRLAQIAGLLLLLGVILFSGSLYLLVLTATPGLGVITPFGGLALIAGWLIWFAALLAQRSAGGPVGDPPRS